jgi:excisionase family DNA binding protein
MTPQHEWVSVEEAARRLGISVSTVRRRIEAGTLVGEREVIGGSRERYKVRLDASQEASGTIHDTVSRIEPGCPPLTPQALATTPQDASGITRRSLGILDNVLRTNAETMAKQAERIADLMRQLGAAEATARLLAEQRADFARWLDEAREENARLRAEAGRRRWWRWW